MKWSGKLNQNLIIWKIYRGILYIKYLFKYSNNVIMLISWEHFLYFSLSRTIYNIQVSYFFSFLKKIAPGNFLILFTATGKAAVKKKNKEPFT